MTTFEETRASYRPDRISTLFVGESAPHGGTFFYNGDSNLYREIRDAFGGKDAFLDDFKARGFFLDDLVLEPVNHLQARERRQLCRHAVPAFAQRLQHYRPHTVIALLYSIREQVAAAIRDAGMNCDFYCTPYPGFGNQPRFRTAMAEIIPHLREIRGKQRKEDH
jgi:hypothetical protein